MRKSNPKCLCFLTWSVHLDIAIEVPCQKIFEPTSFLPQSWETSVNELISKSVITLSLPSSAIDVVISGFIESNNQVRLLPCGFSGYLNDNFRLISDSNGSHRLN